MVPCAPDIEPIGRGHIGRKGQGHSPDIGVKIGSVCHAPPKPGRGGHLRDTLRGGGGDLRIVGWQFRLLQGV